MAREDPKTTLRRYGTDLVEAATALEQLLTRSASVAEAVTDAVFRDQVEVLAALRDAGEPAAHRELSQALDAFHVARRHFRVELLRLGLDQGHTVSDLARALGVSRQFATRLLEDAG